MPTRLVSVAGDGARPLHPDGRPFFAVIVSYVGHSDRAWAQFQPGRYDPALIETDFRLARAAGIYLLLTLADYGLSYVQTPVSHARLVARRFAAHPALLAYDPNNKPRFRPVAQVRYPGGNPLYTSGTGTAISVAATRGERGHRALGPQRHRHQRGARSREQAAFWGPAGWTYRSLQFCWAHGLDARTYLPHPDVLLGDCAS